MNQVAGTLLPAEGVGDSPAIKQKAESVHWENIRGVLGGNKLCCTLLQLGY